MTHAQAKALYLHQLNRKWGHTIALARGWARLILDRLRGYVGSQEGAITTARQRPTPTTHMNSLVSLTLHMQGKEETSRTNFLLNPIGCLTLLSL